MEAKFIGHALRIQFIAIKRPSVVCMFILRNFVCDEILRQNEKEEKNFNNYLCDLKFMRDEI